MRVQHNISALNSYRNYTNNTNTVAKNLEKLSSGFRINRAGDDAAGLAISEKMRAQITGLETAQKNAQDGVSLVQTAEGALTEVHSMLNRMVELADQSANGTYQDKTDRAQLQKEVDALKSEIDRIADATNFNGINLLDGSMGAGGVGGAVKAQGFDAIKGDLMDGLEGVNAVKAKSKFSIGKATASQAWQGGEKFTLNFGTSDGKSYEFTLKAEVDAKTKITKLVGENGKVYKEIAPKTGPAYEDRKEADIAEAFTQLMKDTDLGKTYSITFTGGNISMDAREGGKDVAIVTSLKFTGEDKAGASVMDTTAVGDVPKIDKTNTKEGADATKSLDLTKVQTFNGKSKDKGGNLEEAIFEIGGKKFAFLTGGLAGDDKDKAIKALKDAGVEHFVEVGTAGATNPVAADITKMVEKIQYETGMKVEQGTNTTGTWAASATGNSIILKDGLGGTTGKGGLTLQIGDTAADYNQLNVTINDTHVASLGIQSVDISKQDNAKAAVDIIKEAINKVSDTRGTLGAAQNRLEHTINNLSVTTENMTAAESRIRDVDVAKEMMAYTKNNILVQSAQAMLAQANQTPQGVLQLLQ